MNRKVVAIIQARKCSTRLPGKVLLHFGPSFDERNVLDWVVQRVERFTFIDEYVVLLDGIGEEFELREHASMRGYNRHVVLRMSKLGDGSNDLLNAYVEAINSTKATDVVRITADCPFISPCLAEEVWSVYRQRGQYTANVTVPAISVQALDGFDVEIMPASALIKLNEQTRLTDYDRHHVTPAIRSQLETTRWYVPQPYVHNYKLSLDTMQDYLYMFRIAFGLDIRSEWPEVIREANRWRLAPCT